MGRCIWGTLRCNDRSVSVSAIDHVVRPLTSTPLEWFPRLRDATPAQRANWQPIGGGIGIHWPDVDENLSIAGLLAS